MKKKTVKTDKITERNIVSQSPRSQFKEEKISHNCFLYINQHNKNII